MELAGGHGVLMRDHLSSADPRPADRRDPVRRLSRRPAVAGRRSLVGVGGTGVRGCVSENASMTQLVSAFPMLFADAPNPADCPHHRCGYYQHVTAGGLAVAFVVAIIVVALLVILAIALLLRRRRRRRRIEAARR